MKSKLVGTQFAQAFAPNLSKGDFCIISHEQKNKYDENALLVTFGDENVGYIGKGTDLYDLDRGNFPLDAKVVDFLRSQDDDQFEKHKTGTIVSMTLETEDFVELISKNDVDSFNEESVVINFNEETHTYTHENNILTGATTYIKKYIKPFDDFMVGRCANSWGLERKTIEDAWELGRDLASSFGTGLHQALQFEDLYRQYTKKDGSRCFNIKHPMIRKIVFNFFEFYEKLGFEFQAIYPEALISCVDEGITALADRVVVIDNKNKICALEDYKINHSFDKKGSVSFVNIPNGLSVDSNKLYKLAFQLKVQEYMLNKSGWTVVRKTGFVFSDKWEMFEVPNLDGFNIVEGVMESK